MKTTVAPYATAAKCLRIECRNGLIIRLTRYPNNLVMSNGAVYETDSGYDFTGYEATASLSPSAIDVEGFAGVGGITRDAIQSGVFDGARAYLFACDYTNPVEDYEPITASIMGKTTLEDDKYRTEEMALIDALNQATGLTYTAQCRHAFGSMGYAECKKDLAALTVTGTITHVTSGSSFRDSARAEAADYFKGGRVEFTSGANAGLKAQEVKAHAADGTLATFEPFYYPPAVGDTYTLIPGCDKSLAACRDRWDNVINFGGFPNMPTSSQYSEIGGA